MDFSTTAPVTESPDTGEGRRERRARETRRNILLAAGELFAERGLDAVTVDEIANRADVARATFFNYFPSKESLCLEMGQLQVEMLHEAMGDGRIHGPTAGEKIGQAMRLMAEFPGRNPAHCREILTRALGAMKPGELPEHRTQVFSLFEGWVREGQESGEFRADVQPCELACFLMGLQFQAMVAWAYGLVPGALADHEVRVLQLALEGLQNTKRTAREGEEG